MDGYLHLRGAKFYHFYHWILGEHLPEGIRGSGSDWAVVEVGRAQRLRDETEDGRDKVTENKGGGESAGERRWLEDKWEQRSGGERGRGRQGNIHR